MKKCLITGGAGTIGIPLIEKLLEVGKYEITVIDLKSPKATRRLQPFKDRINIIYGDIACEELMLSLIKEHDVIFHLAGVLPPNALISESLIKEVDYKGTAKLVDLIKRDNAKCYFVYPSVTTLYHKVKEVNVSSNLKVDSNDYYSKYKLEAEKYIENNLKNYTIYRLPMVIDKNSFEHVMYNINENQKIELVSNTLVAKAFVKSLTHKKVLNKKKYILSGGKNFLVNSDEFLRNILESYGISGRYFLMHYLLPQNYYSHIYKTTLNDILDYQDEKIEDIFAGYKSLKKSRRCIQRLLAYNKIKKLKERR